MTLGGQPMRLKPCINLGFILILATGGLLAACQPASTATSLAISATATSPQAPTLSPSATATLLPTVTSTMMVTPTMEPTPVPIEQNPQRLIGYFTSWGIAGRGYRVTNIPGDMLTHINYAFSVISPQEDKCVLGDPVADVQKFYGANESFDHKPDLKDALHGAFGQFLKLKVQYPHLKVMISIGGWNGSARFSDVALTEDTRRQFVDSCINLYFRKYPGVFDGVDVDWEYPVSGGLQAGRPEDRHNFTLLLQEFRRQLDLQGQADGKNYLLTIAAPAGPDTYANLELDQIHKTLNWINLMTYDFHGSWDATTNFNSPLYKTSTDPSTNPVVSDQFNVDAAVQAYLAAGIPPQKLAIGVPFYGRGWQGVPDINHGLYQPATGPAHGRFEPGVFTYSEVKNSYLPTYPRYWQDEALVPWIYDPGTGIMITYEDPQSVALKAGYVNANHLSGMMFWELSNDGGELLTAAFQTLTGH
jgi:chitinase